MDYWLECISEIFNEVGINATSKQIKNVAELVEGVSSSNAEIHGHELIPNPLLPEYEDMKRELRILRDKRLCKTCHGHGVILSSSIFSQNRILRRCECQVD